MAYVAKTQQTDGVPGWAKGVTRYYPYADSLTCEQADAQYNALTDEQQLAQTTLIEPTESGKKKQVRSCSVGADTTWQLDTDSGGDGYTEPGGSSGNSTPTATSTLIGHYTA